MLDLIKSHFPDELWLKNNYGSELPELINNLHLTSSDTEFDALFKKFTGIVLPMGVLIPLSLPAAKVLVDLLKHTGNIHRKIRYCGILAVFLRNTQVKTRYRPQYVARNQQPRNIDSLRQQLEVYDAIATGFDTYISFLTNDDPYLQILSIEILSLLIDKEHQPIPDLLDCLSTTSDELMKALTLWVLADMTRFKIELNAGKEFAEKLVHFIETAHSLIFRASAALARVHFHLCTYDVKETPPPVPAIVIDVLAELFSADMEHIFSEVDDQYVQGALRRTLPFTHKKFFSILSGHSRTQNGYKTWISALSKSEISSINAHLHCREMIEIAFMRSDFNETQHYWSNQQYIGVRKPQLEIEYRIHTKKFKYLHGKPLIDRQRNILEAVVNCDPFWEIPTNLFSFYYGLQDERDELRKLLEQAK